MKFCDECDGLVTRKYYRCIVCQRIAHENCAIRSKRVNQLSQFYCFDHKNLYTEGGRTRHELHMARSVNVHEQEENWGQDESESEVEEVEENPHAIISPQLRNSRSRSNVSEASQESEESEAEQREIVPPRRSRSRSHRSERRMPSAGASMRPSLTSSRPSRSLSQQRLQEEGSASAQIPSNAQKVGERDDTRKNNHVPLTKNSSKTQATSPKNYGESSGVNVNKQPPKRGENFVPLRPQNENNFGNGQTYQNFQNPPRAFMPSCPIFGPHAEETFFHAQNPYAPNNSSGARETSQPDAQYEAHGSFRAGRQNNSQQQPQNNSSQPPLDSDYEFFMNNRQFIRNLKNKSRKNNATSTQTDYHGRTESQTRNNSHDRNRVSFAHDNMAPMPNQDVQQNLIWEILRRQDMRDERLESAKLPIVKKIGTDWLTFYEAFMRTYQFHSPYSNIARIQEAIQCQEILSMGGSNLFSPNEFYRTVNDINKRVGDPKKLSMQSLKELLGMKAPRDHSDTRILISFINAVRNYANLQESYGNYSSQSDQNSLALLANMLPREYQKKWYEKVLNIENNLMRVASVMDLREFLSALVPTLERIQYGKDLIELREAEKKNKTQTQTSKRGNLNTTSESGKPAWQFKCWFCKSDSHLVKDCTKVRSVDGLEAIEMGKKYGMCLICCKEKYNGKCTSTRKPSACKHCSNKSHWYTVCPKRKAESQNTSNCHTEAQVNNTASKNKSSKKSSKPATAQPQVTATNENIQTENALSNNQFFREQGVERQVDPSLLWDSSNPNSNNMHMGSKYVKYVAYEFPLFNTLNPNTGTNKSLLSIVVLKVANEQKAFLLDSGSTISLIDEDFANKLKVGGYRYPLTLFWSGSQKRVDNFSRIIQLSVSTIADEPKHHTLYFHTFYQLGIGDQKFNSAEIKNNYPHLREMNLVDYEKIIGVIGIDQVNAFVQHKKFLPPKSEASDSLIGIRGPLGDYVMGSSESISQIYRCLAIDSGRSLSHVVQPQAVFSHQSESSELARMEELLLGEEYYEINFSDRNDANDTIALKLLEKHVKKSPDGNHYVAPLLWKDEDPILPTESSFNVASRRLTIMLEHAKRHNKITQIEDQVKSLLNKGYASEVSSELIQNPSKKAFYIPIFFITPPGKRMRMIWDAKAEVEKGKSLNNFLLSGPNLYNDMLKILFQMREGKYLFKGDCLEMFHQIEIKEDDKDALRFLFKFSDQPLKAYKMDRMVFGVVCSPTTSQFVVRKIADEHQTSFPKAAETIRDSIYVDDLVKSVNSIEEGSKILQEVRQILKSGGFELVKLNATHKKLLKSINKALTKEETLHEKTFSENEIEKLLGYLINFRNDSLQISISMPRIQKILAKVGKPTKVEVLKVTLSLFDPLGLTMFFVAKFKLIYHWVCNENIDWDHEIPDKLMIYWQKAVASIPKLNDIAIPRCYSDRITESKICQLWTFVDAGKDMECVVTYVRFLDDNHKQIDFSLIGSKTFTVPSKQKRTIPELELDAVERGVNYSRIVIDSHSIKFHEIFVITDSSCVYEWLINGVTKPTIYIKNRIKKINDHELKFKLLWVPTNLQTADMGTKWSSFPEFSYENDWFTPKLFLLPQSSWPDFKPPQHNAKFHKTSEIIKEKYFGAFFDPSRHSSLNKAVNKAKSLLLRWKYKTQLKRLNEEVIEAEVRFEKKEITKNDFDKCLKKLRGKISKVETQKDDVNHCREIIELFFYKDAQEEFFKEEMELLGAGKTLPCTSKLFKVSPFLDEHGVMRATTRISNNEQNRINFPLDMIGPIILPSNHHITKLVILQAHNTNRHIHNNSVVASLMQRFYIPHIRWIVNKTIKEECYACRLKTCKPVVPRMGDLPTLRLDAYEPVFKNAIVDVCGPFKVVVGRKPAKRWLFVASCLTTRVVHIEVLYHLTANSAILALNNLINLRGKPDVIYSDMGTNFVGGYKELIETFNDHNKKLIEQGMEPLKIKWENSPAKASHMNGCVERLIGLIKNALHKMEEMLNKKLYHLDDESFRAFICEAVNILNNRPLCMTPIKGTTHEFLTPNHFLMLKPNFVSRPIDHNPRLITKNWRDVQNLANILWEHWLKAYIPTILYREKWIKKSTPLQVGDLVITADPTVYNSWRLAKVVEVEMGSQDQVRKVKVQLGKNSSITDQKILRSSRRLLKAYNAEKPLVVSRPATAVAAINLSALD